MAGHRIVGRFEFLFFRFDPTVHPVRRRGVRRGAALADKGHNVIRSRLPRGNREVRVVGNLRGNIHIGCVIAGRVGRISRLIDREPFIPAYQPDRELVALGFAEFCGGVRFIALRGERGPWAIRIGRAIHAERGVHDPGPAGVAAAGSVSIPICLERGIPLRALVRREVAHGIGPEVRSGLRRGGKRPVAVSRVVKKIALALARGSSRRQVHILRGIKRGRGERHRLVLAGVFLELAHRGIQTDKGVLTGDEKIFAAGARPGLHMEHGRNRKDKNHEQRKDRQH